MAVLFFILSEYKRVDFLGRHLKYIGERITRNAGYTNDCIVIIRRFKFLFASENAVFLRISTEKVLNSLAAHTVSIDYGNKFLCDGVYPDRYKISRF